MNLFNHKRRNRFEGAHLIGILLIAVGVIVGVLFIFIDFRPPFNNMLPLIVCLLIIGTIILFTHSGTEIDFTKNEFREYFSFCGIKIGEWTPLPSVSKIKVKSTIHHATNTPNGISPTLSGNIKEHKVLLYANEPTPLLSFSFKKREAAIKQADILAINLRTKVEIE